MHLAAPYLPRFSSLAILRPPSIRPPHRKLFLINENGKLGPHIVTSRDVLGSRIDGSRCIGQQPGVRVAGPGQVLRLPAWASRVCRGNLGPWRPRRTALRFAAPSPGPATAGAEQLVLTRCAT